MAFKNYNHGAYKKEIRELLRERLKLKDRIRYHQKKEFHHGTQIQIIIDEKLVEVEKKLDNYLNRKNK